MATLTAQVKSFTKSSAKSGARGLSLLHNSIEHMFEHNDWTPLAWLIAQSEGADSTRLRAITNVCVGGVKMVKDKDQPSGLRITLGHNAAPTEYIGVLKDLVKAGKSFRSNDTRKALLGAPEPSEFDVAKYAKTVSNKLIKEDVSVDALLKAISSL